MTIQSINPATEEVIETFEPHTAAQIDEMLTTVAAAQKRWRDRSFAERAEVLRRVAALLRERKDELARAATSEMGKPIAESEAEVEKCAWVCEYYAEGAERFLADEQAPSTATESYVAYRPLGVLLAIMPWNFPYWQALRAAAPALMAGNAVILKHASNVTRCALHIERLFADSAPDTIFRTILAPGAEVEALIADRRIAAVTLTGSDAAGVSVASAAGHALKKTVLELGGSDAFIVLEDADLDAAAQMAVKARFQNTGQSCIAAKRFIVVESVAEEFEKKFVEAAAKLKVGDPLDRATQIGPVARGDLREALADQVTAIRGDGREGGARRGSDRRSRRQRLFLRADDSHAGDGRDAGLPRGDVWPGGGGDPRARRRARRRASQRLRLSALVATCGRATSSVRVTWRGGWSPAASSSTA